MAGPVTKHTVKMAAWDFQDQLINVTTAYRGFLEDLPSTTSCDPCCGEHPAHGAPGGSLGKDLTALADIFTANV